MEVVLFVQTKYLHNINPFLWLAAIAKKANQLKRKFQDSFSRTEKLIYDDAANDDDDDADVEMAMKRKQ